jgi:Putative zinc-finger
MTSGAGCEFAHDDAVYVLGAMDAAERTAYERHLATCEECSRRVRDFAGLPGLLTRVPVDVLESPGEPEPVPETLLPALVTEVRRSQRRRTALRVGLAVAAAVALVVGTVGVTTRLQDDPAPSAGPSSTSQPSEPSQTTAPAVRMDSVGGGWVDGWVSLTQVAWGTRIDLECGYGPSGDQTWTYAMVVRTRDGRSEQIGTWRVGAGQDAHVTLATSATPEEITQVEVLTGDGTPVLLLEPAAQ